MPGCTNTPFNLKPVKAEEEFFTLPNVEYGLTDATRLGADNTFLAINYFFPGEAVLKPDSDPLAHRYGEGATHARYAAVEHLVEFYYHDEDGIFITGTPPIQLEMLGPNTARNWEAIAVLEGYGFSLATDKYPYFIFGFVPFP